MRQQEEQLPDIKKTKSLIRIFPDLPVSQRLEWKRKGTPEYWACRVKPGRILFELDGVSEDLAKRAFELGGKITYSDKIAN